MQSPNLDLEAVVRSICNEYVEKWKTEDKRCISIPSFEQAYI